MGDSGSEESMGDSGSDESTGDSGSDKSTVHMSNCDDDDEDIGIRSTSDELWHPQQYTLYPS